jgi:hypothetical protein
MVNPGMKLQVVASHFDPILRGSDQNGSKWRAKFGAWVKSFGNPWVFKF